MYTCICSAQFANLCYFEIVLRKLEISKLQTNFETGIQFQNCVAILLILEIALFLKKNHPSTAAYNSVKQLCTFP